MAKPFDTTLKHLLEVYPQYWLRLLGINPNGPIAVVDADLATVSAEADKVFRIEESQPWILHLELQVSYDAGLPDRMLLYNVLLQRRHSLPVRSSVLLLRPQANGPAMSSSLRHALPSGEEYLEFRYEVLRLWQISLDAVFASGVGTLPLAPLAAGAASRIDEVIDRMDRRVHAQIQSAEAADIWAATYVLLGLSYPSAISQALLKRVRTMEESVTYQEILHKGEARGQAKGFIDGARRVLLTFASRRFGSPPTVVVEAINSLDDFDQLERLTERVPEVSGWEELLTGE